MTDGKAEFIVFVAAEIDIELLNVFGFAVALHIAFRGAKCTLHLREYFFSLDIGHSCERDKERIAAVIDYVLDQWFKFIRIKIYIRHLFHPFSILQTCDPSAARAAWSGWGFPQFLSLPEERSDDCTPQAGVTVGHPDAQRREWTEVIGERGGCCRVGVSRKRWALSVRLEGVADNLTRQRRFHVRLLFQ